MAKQIHTRTGRDARTAIVATAVDLFVRHGIEQTTLAAIAAELHVTKAAIYHHYPSKDEIVVAALAPLIGEIDALVTAIAGGAVASRDVGHRVIDMALEHRELILLCRADGLTGLGDDVLHNAREAAQRLLTALATAGSPPAPVRARAFVGAISTALSDSCRPAEISEVRTLATWLVQRHTP